MPLTNFKDIQVAKVGLLPKLISGELDVSKLNIETT